MNKKYVPSLKVLKESLSTSRFEILNKMLEGSNPAFVLMSILKRADKELIKESAEFVCKFGDIVDTVYSILESNDDSEYVDDKYSNSTGHGSLKKLIGEEDAEDLSSGDWMRIGARIADMEGYNRRDYIGMMNFLATSCFMHEEIRKNLSKDLKSHLLKNKVYQSPSRLKGTKELPEITPGRETRTSIVKPNVHTYKRNVFDSKENNISSYYKICESADKLSIVNSIDNEYDDNYNGKDYRPKFLGTSNIGGIIQMLAYTLSQLKDVDIADISNDIEDYETGNYEPDEIDNDFMTIPNINYENSYGGDITNFGGDGYLSETKGYSRGEKARLRYERGNGQGGLKGLVNKSSGDDLENEDLKSIASQINDMNDDERGEYMSYVGFLGSSCDIFMYIKRGFLQRIRKNGKDTDFMENGKARKERWQK